ncbi:hypothetical protein ABZ897_26845 [Nonomuraea sp. NPDC046802]|uniref:hypothetical protein n=1 Tax=Nonomuraea sp. NPDC046802 TaxID=3154919 RepID=UPI0033C64018
MRRAILLFAAVALAGVTHAATSAGASPLAGACPPKVECDPTQVNLGWQEDPTSPNP